MATTTLVKPVDQSWYKSNNFNGPPCSTYQADYKTPAMTTAKLLKPRDHTFWDVIDGEAISTYQADYQKHELTITHIIKPHDHEFWNSRASDPVRSTYQASYQKPAMTTLKSAKPSDHKLWNGWNGCVVSKAYQSSYKIDFTKSSMTTSESIGPTHDKPIQRRPRQEHRRLA